MTADVLRYRLVHHRIARAISRDAYDALVAQLDAGRPVGAVARTLAANLHRAA